MPTQLQIQNTILSAQLVMANLANANLSQLQVGNNEVSWTLPRQLNRNINALQVQYNYGDYISSTTLGLYDCLNSLIGFDTTVNTLDPNFQIPNTDIVIINPASYAAPLDVPFASFDAATQQGDGGRIIYYNTNWVGLNPQLALTSPGMTALYVGLDYSLISTGGIQLLPGGNLPEIYDGQIIRSTGYDIA